MESFNCQPLFDRLTYVAFKTGTLHEFSKLKSPLEKIKFCWNTKVSYEGDLVITFKNEILQVLEVLYGMGLDHEKSETLALQAKERGSKAYLKKEDADAHLNYTESLKLAPAHSSVLPLAYGNRSAVLFQMGRYKEALQDMNRAEQNGYPDSIVHKLLARRCSCFIMLGYRSHAKEVLELCKKHLLVIPFEAKENFEKNVFNLEKKIGDLHQEDDTSTEESLKVPPLFKGESSSVTYMSSALEMRLNDSYGRHVVASEPIHKGSVVFVEKPYAAILLPEHHRTHCHSCFSLASNPVPCQTCRDVVFCKEECREQGNLWHKYECCILHILSAVGIAHLAVRVIFITGWNLYCKVSNEDTEGRIPGINRGNVYSGTNPSDAYRTVYHLMPHFDSSLPEDQLQYCLAALLLGSAVLDKSSFTKQKDVDVSISAADANIDVVHLATAIMRHIAQLVSNAHAITQVMAEKSDESTRLEAVAQKRIASAIYPTASLMNHSCQPTIINSFINDLLVIRTIQDVQQGDQIYNCYGPHYCRQTLGERQEALKLQYFFTCYCDPCTQPQYKLREAAWSGFHCESCKGISSWTTEGKNAAVDEGASQGLIICLECHQMRKPSQDLVQICTRVSALQEDAEAAMRIGDLSTAAVNLRSAIKLGNKVYLPENHYYVTLKDMLVKTLVDAGNFVGCCQSLRECLHAVESRYGPESVELAHELLKFSDVLALAASSNDRLTGELQGVKTKIDKIFTLNYGPQWKKYMKI